MTHVESPPSSSSSSSPSSSSSSLLPRIPKPKRSSKYYKVMVHHIFPHLYALVSDPDNEVRRAASETIVKLALRVDPEDVVTLCLSVPLRLVKEGQKRASSSSSSSSATAAGAAGGTTAPGAAAPATGGGGDDGDADGGGGGGRATSFYRRRTREQVDALLGTVRECHEIRRRVLCGIARKLLEDTNKFVRYGMMQFLGPLIASFYPLDRGSMIGGMGGLMYGDHHGTGDDDNDHMGTLGIGVESVDIAKASTGLERMMGATGGGGASSAHYGEYGRGTTTIEDVFSYNHSLHGLEMILHGESALNHAVLGYGGGCNANKDPFGTMGPQFFPHANGMVGRSSALDDDDTDSFLLRAYLKSSNPKQHVVVGQAEANDPSSSSSQPPSSSQSSSLHQSPRALLPKFLLESRSDALALSRIVCHRTGGVPIAGSSSIAPMPYPPLVSGRPDPEDLKSIANTLLVPFIGMASFQTGEESTDAEMKVYCAYSLPAVILLFGGSNWEKDGLKRCFLDLIGRNVKEESPNNASVGADSPPNPVDAAAQQPPLPVKRCLASSVHAVAHMLGPDVASRDAAFLAAFEQSFLCDPDEAIRLNVLKNLASFLGALLPGHRNAYLPMMHSLIMGDDVLGASRRRSASNPGVLNWRQRDAVARMLPDLIVLYSASLNREYLWPMLKTLLTDSVSAVRENAGWSVPVLLRRYITCPSGESEGSAWVSEVTDWLRETFLDEVTITTGARTSRGMGSFARRLKKQMTSSEGAYSRRQGYCRILAGVALAMRMGEGGGDCDDGLDLASHPNDKRMPSVPVDPFGKLSPYEWDQFRSIVVHDLLPPALEMALDCVANVRLTLTKCLKVLPLDIRKESHVEDVLSTLEEELMTWDVGDMMPNQGEFMAIE